MAYHDSQATYLDKGPSTPVQIYNPFLKPPYASYLELHDFMPRGYVIPSWLREAFRLTKVPTSTIDDYKALRKVLSVNDLILLTATQRISFYGPHLSNLPDMINWNKATDVGGNAAFTDLEYCGIITHGAKTDAIHAEALAQLKIDEDPASGEKPANILANIDEGDEYYFFELSASNQYYIHIKPGILNALQDRTYALRFVSDYLKVLYGFLPVNAVCRSPVFKDYLSLL
jgi:hypothetical protein